LSFESRLLTVERLLMADDNLENLAKQALQAIRNQSQGNSGSGNCPQTGFYAQILGSSSGKYSFRSVVFAGDGSASLDFSTNAHVGLDTDPDGYAMESDGCPNVPTNTIVWLNLQQPGSPYYLFSYQHTVMARTKVITSYPNVAAAYYGCETQTIAGTPSEGGAATITTNGDTFYALNTGSTIPPQGTPVICSRTNVDYTVSPPQPYWTFSYNG
jgi:hypothetical protein